MITDKLTSDKLTRKELKEYFNNIIEVEMLKSDKVEMHNIQLKVKALNKKIDAMFTYYTNIIKEIKN